MSSMLNKSTLAVFKRTALSLVVVGTLYSTSLYAQDIELNLPSQPLQQSIQQLARQSNVDILYFSENLKSKTAPQIKGKVSVERALHQLLQGTNLTAQKNGDVWSIVEKKQSTQPSTLNKKMTSDAVQLPVITITAYKEKETEKNYTVKNSSSATKLNLSLKDTPQSVSVITQKQMEDQNLTQAVQVLEQAPGIVVASYGAPGAGQAQYYSRGFEITNIQVDGMATTAAGQGLNIMGALDTGIYEQVDVVRGSTGLMAGVGDPSASVNFKRKRPTEEFKGSVNLGYGSLNRKRSMFDVSGGLNEDNSIRGRMVAIYSDGDSYINNLDTENKTLYGILETDLTKKDTLSFGATYSDQHTNGAAPHGPTLATVLDEKLYTQDFGRSYNPATPWTYTDTKIFNGFTEYKHEFNDNWKFNLSYGFSKLDYDRLYGSIGTASSTDGGFYDIENDKASLAYGHNEIDAKLHNLDLFLSGKFDAFGQMHDVVLGFNGYQGKFDLPQHVDDKSIFGTGSQIPISMWNDVKDGFWFTKQLSTFATAQDFGMSQANFDFLDNALFTRMGDAHLKEKQYGGYLATRLRPTNRISAILGTRYAKWNRDYSIYVVDMDQFWEPETVNPASTYKLFGNQNYKADGRFTPYAGLLFDFNKDITGYLSYTGVYKPQTDPNSMYGVDGNILKPITGNTWELGVNAGFFDDALNIHLAAFRMLQNNVGYLANVSKENEHGDFEYVTPPKDPLTGGYVNGYNVPFDGVITKGGEFSLSGAITPNWLISASYTYMQDKTDKYRVSNVKILKNGTYDISEGDSQSRTFYNTYENPKHLIKINTSYKFLDRYTVGGGLIWKSKLDYRYGLSNSTHPEYEQQLYKALSQDDYTIVNLFGRYQVNQNLVLGLNINNVFDEIYRINKNGSYYGEPRNVMATLQLKY